jgi:hypothetical protein
VYRIVILVGDEVEGFQAKTLIVGEGSSACRSYWEESRFRVNARITHNSVVGHGAGLGVQGQSSVFLYRRHQPCVSVKPRPSGDGDCAPKAKALSVKRSTKRGAGALVLGSVSFSVV